MKFNPVHTTLSAAYFVDRQGGIWRLAPSGSPVLVGNLVLLEGGQPEIAFAVSPDGQHFMATILTWPPFMAGSPMGQFKPDAHWYYNLESVDVGHPAKTIISRDLGVTADHDHSWPNGQTMLVNWDEIGPVATTNAWLWGQGGEPTPSLKPFGPHLVHLTPDGTLSSPIGGSDCLPVDEVANQTVLCTNTGWSAFAVRTGGGQVMWSRTVGDLSSPVILSPDGRAAANYQSAFTEAGQTVALPGPANRNVAIYVQGWIDATTIVGDNFGELVLYNIVSGGEYMHLGTAGLFVGAT
jgi:hypothetical protein